MVLQLSLVVYHEACQLSLVFRWCYHIKASHNSRYTLPTWDLLFPCWLTEIFLGAFIIIIRCPKSYSKSYSKRKPLKQQIWQFNALFYLIVNKYKIYFASFRHVLKPRRWILDDKPLTMEDAHLMVEFLLKSNSGFCDATSHKRGDATGDKFVTQSVGSCTKTSNITRIIRNCTQSVVASCNVCTSTCNVRAFLSPPISLTAAGMDDHPVVFLWYKRTRTI